MLHLWHGVLKLLKLAVIRGLGQTFDAEFLSGGEEILEVFLVDIYFSSIHEVEDGHHVGEANSDDFNLLRFHPPVVMATHPLRKIIG